MSKEIKACPFCGGEAKIIHADDVTLPYRIRCKNINCDVRPSTTWFKHKEDAITKWNTRKPIDKIVERLEECVEHHVTKYEKAFTFREECFENGKYRAYRQAIEIVKGGAE